MKEQRQGTLLQSQPSGNTTDKENLNSELIKKRKLDIFDLVEVKERGDIFLALGRIKIKSYESVDEAIEDVGNRDWDLIVNLIAALISANEIMKENSSQILNDGLVSYAANNSCCYSGDIVTGKQIGRASCRERV